MIFVLCPETSQPLFFNFTDISYIIHNTFKNKLMYTSRFFPKFYQLFNKIKTTSFKEHTSVVGFVYYKFWDSISLLFVKLKHTSWCGRKDRWSRSIVLISRQIIFLVFFQFDQFPKKISWKPSHLTNSIRLNKMTSVSVIVCFDVYWWKRRNY